MIEASYSYTRIHKKLVEFVTCEGHVFLVPSERIILVRRVVDDVFFECADDTYQIRCPTEKAAHGMLERFKQNFDGI